MSRKKLAVASVLGPVVAVLAVLSMGQGNPPRFGDPLPNVTDAELAAFLEGQDAFEEEEVVADGLGPVFNENSCVACHNVGATGGGSERLETRFGRVVGGLFDPLAFLGGSLIQDQGIGGPFLTPDGRPVFFDAERVPPEANVVAGRRSTPLFGLGLVDNVPDATLIRIAEMQATSATAGRVNMVVDVASGLPRVGRFGWKSQIATLFTFSGDAYLNEMGITTFMFPAENCPQGQCELLDANPVPSPNDNNDDLVLFTAFMTFLAPPPPQAMSVQEQRGADLFFQIGCNNCHLPSLQTGPSSSPALDRVTFFPFSDFLLHDMGSLGDGIEQGGAGRFEMRTAPLWGVRLMTTLLHDGSAKNIPQAILRHDGQGRAARERFATLSNGDQKDLVAFLKSL